MQSYISLIRKNHIKDILEHIKSTKQSINSLSIYENTDIKDLHFHYQTLAECCVYLKQVRTPPNLDVIIPPIMMQKFKQETQ